MITMYDKAGAITVRTVKDHTSALACGKGLDACAKKVEKLFSKLLREGDEQIAPEVARKLGAQLRQCLLRRSEHWKAEAHRRHQEPYTEPAVSRRTGPDREAATGNCSEIPG